MSEIIENNQSSEASETNRDALVVDESNFDASESAVEKLQLTQDELNDIISKRLERERKKFADYEEVKSKASEYEKQLEEQRLKELSEVERAQEQARKFEEELSALKGQLETERKKAEQQKIYNAFAKEASGADIVDIDAALKLSDLSAVSIDEEGNVNGVSDIVKSLVENKPYLVAQKKPTQQPIGQSVNVSGGTVDKKLSDEQRLAEAAAKAKRSGTIADRAAYAKLKKELGR